MFFSFDHEHVVMNLTFRNPRPFKNNPQTSNLKAFNKTYNNKSKRFQMGKRRASELSTKRLEILGLAPNRSNKSLLLRMQNLEKSFVDFNRLH